MPHGRDNRCTTLFELPVHVIVLSTVIFMYVPGIEGCQRELVFFCESMCDSVFLGLRCCGPHRTEDVNVNTVSQRKGMCEARKKTLGTKSKGGREG